ncbi:SCP-like protein [Teladorsagia circumcincta]|uniref:SCP-like protein n=1 Tax=Teladorsagia circumcincta TaxID=45464 RepID=A0A2G9UY35_TELCI|nr:SCP-like protein [Teladorsagia circumcincta]
MGEGNVFTEEFRLLAEVCEGTISHTKLEDKMRNTMNEIHRQIKVAKTLDGSLTHHLLEHTCTDETDGELAISANRLLNTTTATISNIKRSMQRYMYLDAMYALLTKNGVYPKHWRKEWLEDNLIEETRDDVDMGDHPSLKEEQFSAREERKLLERRVMNVASLILEIIRSRLAQGLVPNGLTNTKAPSGQNIFQMASASIYDSYDTDLEQDAQNYANGCPPNGSSLASRSQYYGSGEEGENFGVVSANSTYNAVFQAVKSFWREIKLNNINKEMLFTEALAGRPLVRFTQMAWAETTNVGCGAKLCGDQYVVVCRYYPRGNIVGQNIYEVGTTCGSCSDTCTTAYLYKGLCEQLATG